MTAKLKVPSIQGKVHLGCLPEEQVMPQKITTAITIGFKELPTTCETDNIEDTPCYAEMTELLLKRFAAKHYKTIEHLGLVCFEDIRTYLSRFPTASNLSLEIDKLHPPVDQIDKGCQFEILGEL